MASGSRWGKSQSRRMCELCSCNSSPGCALPGCAAPRWGVQGGHAPFCPPSKVGEQDSYDGHRRTARTPRAAATWAEKPASSSAWRPLVSLSTAPGMQVTPKAPQSSRCLRGSLPSEEELYHLPFTGRDGEGLGETWPSPRQSKELTPSLPTGNPPHPESQLDSALPDRPQKSCYHLAALRKMLMNSAPAPGRTARL